MKYYGLFKNNEIIDVNIIPIKADGFETREITKSEYETFKSKHSILLEQEKRITELTNWFDNYFDKQLKQSQWQKNFKVSEDPYFKDENGNLKTYADIEELKEKAELVAGEIRVLKEKLKTEE